MFVTIPHSHHSAPEAIETGPISYDLEFDHVYNTEKHDFAGYVADYATRRYKSGDAAKLQSAWKLLSAGPYNASSSENDLQGAMGSVIVARPAWNISQIGCCAVLTGETRCLQPHP